MQPSPILRRCATAVVLAAWLGAMLVPPVLLVRGRETWLKHWDRPETQSQWDAFRRDMRRQSGRDGPVQRKVPKSVEPPARVWLRDYFPLAVAAWVLFVGVLGGFFTLLATGVLRGPAGRAQPAVHGTPSLAENQAGRHHDDDEQHERDANDTEK